MAGVDEAIKVVRRLSRSTGDGSRLTTPRCQTRDRETGRLEPNNPGSDVCRRRRGSLRLVDALYAALASQLDTLIVATDRGLASASRRATLIERGP